MAAALLCAHAAWSANVGHVPYDIAGGWLIEGDGYGEKAFVRLYLSLDGTMEIYTSSANPQEWRSVTGYDISLRLNTSRLDIKTWTDYIEERLHIPAPLPELRPTVNDPFELPPVRHVDEGTDLNYHINIIQIK